MPAGCRSRRRILLCASLLLVPLPAPAQDFVDVGDPGNACDSLPQGCFGSVTGEFRISASEVTKSEYVAFLNAVALDDPNQLWRPIMDCLYEASGNTGTVLFCGWIERTGSPGSYAYSVVSGHGGEPVNFLSYWSALRYVNWLHNGRPVGPQSPATTEDGAYTLDPGDVAANTVVRNPGARVFLVNEDEWHKAAFYDESTQSYYEYPTSSSAGISCLAPHLDDGDAANCSDAYMPIDGVGQLTPVGAYDASDSPSGTFDQAGNVREWTETIHAGNPGLRITRGGSAGGGAALNRSSNAEHRVATNPNDLEPGIGFRVGTLPAMAVSIPTDLDVLIASPFTPGCNNRLWKLELATGALTELVSFGCAPSPGLLARDASTGDVYIADLFVSPPQVYSVDLTAGTWTLLSQIPELVGIGGLAADQGRLFVVKQSGFPLDDDPVVFELDTVTGAIANVILTRADFPNQLPYNVRDAEASDGRVYWGDAQRYFISEAAWSGLPNLTRYPVNASGNGLLYNVGIEVLGDAVWTAGSQAFSVSRLNGAITTTLPTQSQGTDIEADRDTGLLLMIDPADEDLEVYEMGTGALVQSYDLQGLKAGTFELLPEPGAVSQLAAGVTTLAWLRRRRGRRP